MINETYLHKKNEQEAQNYWEKNKTFSVNENKNKKKFYCVPMIPYPSGNLHMGHVRNYTISDVISRFQRMLGKNVLQPIGWDAFGLPAETAAITNNISPKNWTKINIKNMRKQLKNLGFSYDWNREITTCNSEYYKWEQWFFKKLYFKKLAYKKNEKVNWCPTHETVLANEQVIKGNCWRCNTKIQHKKMSQWFLKITKYAEELLKDLKNLKKWPKNVVSMQKNWIGKSKGFIIKFICSEIKKKIKIYTKKPEKIMEIKFLAISFLHPLAKKLISNNLEKKNIFTKYKNIILSNNEKNKENFLKGIETEKFAYHPITNLKIPIWIASYVKEDYATGAIMGVPDSNNIDEKFFNKYEIQKKYLYLNNKKYFCKKLNSLEKKKEIIEQLIKKKIISKSIQYSLKDWSISRQRYWGAPIPITYTNSGNIIPVPDQLLPVKLPKIKNLEQNSKNLKIKKKWKKTIINGKSVYRETDTFDTFFESSWYYIRYTNPNFKTGMIDIKKAQYWLPIDQYIGGIEHATMHLIYFRFFHKLLRDFGYVKSSEPVKKLLCQGMVLSDAFYKISKNNLKTWYNIEEVITNKNDQGKIISAKLKNGKKINYAGKIKMSKSKNNGINPLHIIKKYGADALRLFLMFAAPAEESLEWNENNVIGMYRFLKKVWKYYFLYIKKNNNSIKQIPKHIINVINFSLHNTIKMVSKDIELNSSFNTAIAHIIKFFNILKKFSKKYNYPKSILKKPLENFLKMLHPFAPHISFVLWKNLKNISKNNIIDFEKWPKYDNKILLTKFCNIVIQINGKKRFILKTSKNINQKELIKKIYEKKIAEKHLYQKKIKKIIYIKNKIINFVIL